MINNMLKMIRKKQFLYFVLYIGSFPLLYLCFILCAKIEFIPLFNNIFLGISIFVFFAYNIFFISKFTDLNINFYLKLLSTLLMVGLGLLAGYVVLIMSIFAFKDSIPFTYDGEKYYLLNEGWVDFDYVVYRKDFITMDKMTFEDSEKTFTNLSKVTNKEARDQLKFYFHKDKQIVKTNNDQEGIEQKENLSNSEFLNNFGLEDVKKIPNSSYGLLEVDRAGARSRWFFVEINDDKIKFISEIPDTSPDISGSVKEDGSILLVCKDINGNEKQYKSSDFGKTFEPVNKK